MMADGALEKKLNAWVSVNHKFATEFGKQKWVSEIDMRSTGGKGNAKNGSAASDLIEMLSAKTAKDLGLNMKMKAGK